jgi:hypothetical protein
MNGRNRDECSVCITRRRLAFDARHRRFLFRNLNSKHEDECVSENALTSIETFFCN